MKIKNSLLLLVSLLTLVSCSYECESRQKFRFRVDDSLALYDIFLYTRILPGFKGGSLPVVLTVMSPDGKRFCDTLSFPLSSENRYGTVEEVKSGVWRDIKWLYRDGVTFPRTGLWVFTVDHLSHKDNLNNVRDFAITLEK
ncbi:MAG: hypothetical protein WCX48_05850 [Bacteroidales bacterium]